jgi:hypothetical protein
MKDKVPDVVKAEGGAECSSKAGAGDEAEDGARHKARDGAKNRARGGVPLPPRVWTFQNRTSTKKKKWWVLLFSGTAVVECKLAAVGGGRKDKEAIL